MKLTGLRRDDARGVYDPAQNAPKAAASQPSQSVTGRNDAHSYSSTISPNNLGYQQNQFMNAQAAQQQSAYQQPQAAQQSAYQQPQVVASEPSVAYLFRLKTGEQTRVSAQLFRIGKDPHNCEYCIRDNPAISRCHASIKYVNNRWYITDLNSTNKTYVNDSPLTPNVDVELISGTSIKLANEDFIFNIFN